MAMTVDQFIVTFTGICLIALVYWFFFMKKNAKLVAGNNALIIVDGGYTPSLLSLPAGKQATLTFLRKDPSPCLEELIIGDLGIRKLLPLNENVPVVVTPPKVGEYVFNCGMNMFKGKIIVS